MSTPNQRWLTRPEQQKFNPDPSLGMMLEMGNSHCCQLRIKISEQLAAIGYLFDLGHFHGPLNRMKIVPWFSCISVTSVTF